MTLRITILGCGSSGGVPRIGGDWGACDPNEPKNRRRRCSLLVEKGEGENWTRLLVDTSPDIYDQFYGKDIDWLDGVFYTHHHADQSHGINDLRAFFLNRFKTLQVYMDSFCAGILGKRFNYCFEEVEGGYPKFLALNVLDAGQSVKVEGAGGQISVLPFELNHGPINVLGFCFDGKVAYSPDVVEVPADSFALLTNLDCWIVDALRREPHPTHAHLDKTLAWIDRVRPKSAVLTNMHIDLDYQTLKKELSGLEMKVEPAFDGMEMHF